MNLLHRCTYRKANQWLIYLEDIEALESTRLATDPSWAASLGPRVFVSDGVASAVSAEPAAADAFA